MALSPTSPAPEFDAPPAPPPLRIGPLLLSSPAVLAPMAGFTDVAFRRLCRRFGAGLVYTELASVEGLVRHSASTRSLLASDPAERPVAAHLYGHDPAAFAAAAAYAESLGCFDLIDINAGCPMPKIVRRGDGAGLIRNPRLLRDIVAAVRGAVRLPVTVKTRIGASPDLANAEDLLRAVEDGGADALALHGRFTCHRHAGPADWAALARVKRVAKIPILGNGGIVRAQQVLDRRRESGVDGVMIGRGALGNPWIFEEVRRLLDGRPPRRPSLAERRAVILEHLDGLIRIAEAERSFRRHRNPPEETGARHFRGPLLHYLKGFRGLTAMKLRLNDIHSRADVVREVDGVLEQAREP